MSDQVVLLPRRSRRLATFIPASYWISIGYSQVQATVMEKLQADMKIYCEDNDDDTNVYLREKAHGGILPHHDIMLPHWKKFAKSLNGRASVTHFRIEGIYLPIPVLDIIFPTLQSMHNLISLSLHRTRLDNEGYIRLSSFLDHNSSLQHLAIVDSVVDDLSIAGTFSDALKNHTALERLILNKCGLNNIPILEEVLKGCRGFEVLGIIKDDLGSEGGALMADFIRRNHPLEKICIRHCSIADNEALVLASALTVNTHLKELHLQGNDITEEGNKALLKAVFDSTSMDSIIESNHTCMPFAYHTYRADNLYQRPLLEQELHAIIVNNGISIQQKIRKKVILALCGVDGGLFDLSHLNNLPLQLMPHVLELIQKHTEARTDDVFNMPGRQLEKDALSRLFHTLRGWELPLLFENLRTSSATDTTRKRKRKARGTGKRSCRR